MASWNFLFLPCFGHIQSNEVNLVEVSKCEKTVWSNCSAEKPPKNGTVLSHHGCLRCQTLCNALGTSSPKIMLVKGKFVANWLRQELSKFSAVVALISYYSCLVFKLLS